MTATLTSAEVRWTSTPDRIACQTSHGVIYDDAPEHWREAVLRLLGLSDEEGRAWVERVALTSLAQSDRPWSEWTADDRLKTLADATAEVFVAPAGSEFAPLPDSLDALGAQVDRVWFRGMRRDPSYMVAGSNDLLHGVLLEAHDGTWRRARPIDYEEDYFEGDEHGLGYGRCLDQSGWRMEKAARIVRQIRGISQFVGRGLNLNARLLDVGAGYGYFRQAAAHAGWSTDGVEISRHAAAVAKREFGLDTFVGTVEEYARRSASSYDVLTLFDLIEHVEDPVSLLGTVRKLLLPDGLCVIRTPNLLSIDGDVFKGYYHSLKREHLHFFSAGSLCRALEMAGLKPVYITTESNLLRGFFGAQLNTYAACLRGSDLFAAAMPA